MVEAQAHPSMRYRAMVIITLVMGLFFTTAGWALHKAFANSVDQSAKNTLEAYVVSLLSTMDFDQQGGVLFENVPLPQLSQANSGVYAEIWDQDKLLWRSDSLIGRPLPRVAVTPSVYQFFPNSTLSASRRYLMSLGVEWQEETLLRQFDMVVAVDGEPYRQRLLGYRQTLFTWLLVIGIALLLLQLVFFSWLFRPLSRVVRQLGDIEQGRITRFDDDYPAEVTVLTNSLNAYIDHERRQIEKQKSTLANLAHALKTPLAVLRGALAEQPPQLPIAQQQLDVMTRSIEYQLNNASTMNKQRYRQAIQCVANIDSVVSALRTLNRTVYPEREIELMADIVPNVVFYGEEGDLLEVVGNLLENACKWCQQRVLIRAYNLQGEATQAVSQRLCIEVIDDGVGIPRDQRELILQRGKRLDEQVQGHGIGLSIVSDIVQSYDGQLQFLDAEGGYSIAGQQQLFANGLRVKVIL